MPQPDPNQHDASEPTRTSVHLIVLVHGIRDHGEWEELVKQTLETIPGVQVAPRGYGWFDPVRFLIPGLRKKPQRVVTNNIRQDLAGLKRDFDDIKLSVIAHSFGTYVITEILEDDSNVDLELEYLILCGSVLPRLYNFRKIIPMVKSRIINYAGCRDGWPLVAKLCTYRAYGSAGTFGFQSSGPNNLYFDFGHSGYFSRDFIKKNWLEVFKGIDVNSSFKRRHPAWVRWLGRIFNGAIPTFAVAVAFAMSPLFQPSVNGVWQFIATYTQFAEARVESQEEEFDVRKCIREGGSYPECFSSLSEAAQRKALEWLSESAGS